MQKKPTTDNKVQARADEVKMPRYSVAEVQTLGRPNKTRLCHSFIEGSRSLSLFYCNSTSVTEDQLRCHSSAVRFLRTQLYRRLKLYHSPGQYQCMGRLSFQHFQKPHTCKRATTTAAEDTLRTERHTITRLRKHLLTYASTLQEQKYWGKPPT